MGMELKKLLYMRDIDLSVRQSDDELIINSQEPVSF